MTDATFSNLKVQRATAGAVEDLLTLDSVDATDGNGAALSFINNSAVAGLYVALGRLSASRVDSQTVRLDLGVSNNPGASSGDNVPPLLSLISDAAGRRVTTASASVLAVGGALTAAGATTLSGTLSVTGATTLGSTLSVTGATSLNGGLRVSGNLDVTGTVDGRDVSSDGAKLDQHLSNTTNPHNTTATQVGALVSLAGVRNPGGDIALVASGALTLAPDDAGNRITLGESHSTLTNNPHATTAAQVGALATAGGNVSGILTVAGNVGIRNTALDHPLVVGPAGGGRHLVINDIPTARWGFATGGYALSIQNDGDNGNWMTRVLITKEGNVGIGTTPSSEYKLQVNGRGFFSGDYLFVNVENAGRLRVGAAWGMPGLYSGDDGAKDLSLGVPNGRKVYLGVYNQDAYVEGGTGNGYFKGNVGIGVANSGEKLEVAGSLKVSGDRIKNSSGYGIVETNKTDWLRINPDQQYPGTALYKSLALGTGGLVIGEWSQQPTGQLKVIGATSLATASGNVGIGTAEPKTKLDVAGTIRSTAQTVPSSGAGLEILYEGGQGFLTSYNRSVNDFLDLNINGRELRLNTEVWDGRVLIGSEKSGGLFVRFSNDLWFSDPQKGHIEILNGPGNNWGKMVGFFEHPSSREYKKDTDIVMERDLDQLLADALSTDLVRFRYTGDAETYRLRLGVIVEECPPYLVGDDGKSLSSTEYIAMLHGAIKALASRVVSLEAQQLARQ